MKFGVFAIGVALTLLSSQTAAPLMAQSSPAAQRLAITGISLGLPAEKAVGLAISMGYQITYKVQLCPKGKAKPDVFDECLVDKRYYEVRMSKGDQRITFDFVEFPDQNVTSQIGYGISNTTTTIDQVVAELTARYGPPTTPGKYAKWCVDNCEAYISTSQIGNNHLSIGAYDTTLRAKASEAFARQRGSKAEF